MEEEDEDSIWFVIINILCGVVLLFFAVMIFHLYFRCWLIRRLLRRNHAEDTSSGSNHRSTAASEITSRGLDRSAITSLPTFVYEAKYQEAPLECAVCISEFQRNEAGRVLPECSHCYHVDCIDMWLQSHSDCPLCRARVKIQPIMNRAEASENSFRGVGPAQREGFPMGLSSSADAGPMERVVSRVVMGPTQSEGFPMGLTSSAATLHAGPIEQKDPNTDGSVGSDLELGLGPPNYGALH